MDERKRVLLVVEDVGFAELLVEALDQAGHASERADGLAAVERLAERAYDAAIVDLDTRARQGAAVVAELRRRAPATKVVALLPFGGLAAAAEPVAYHLAVEKPARLAAIMSALAAANVVAKN